MSTDIHQLTQEARKSYHYWHLMLLLKKRRLEKKLLEAGYIAAPAFDGEGQEQVPPEWLFLQEAGFPLPHQMPAFHPQLERMKGIQLFFRVAPAFDDGDILLLDVVRRLADSKYERRTLLRSNHQHESYLQQAANYLNCALEIQSLELVYNAALLWASCHDQDVRDWQPISATFIEVPQPAVKPVSATTTHNPLAILGIESSEQVDDSVEQEATSENGLSTAPFVIGNLFGGD